MTHALAVLATVLAVMSLVPFMRREAWWIRIFDFPRAQILALSGLVLGLGIAVGNTSEWQGGLTFLAASAALVIQSVQMFPYTPFARQEAVSATGDAPADCVISLLIANVLVTNHHESSLLRIIGNHDPDVVLLLEPDDWWDEKMRILETEYPHGIRKPLANSYGMILYSRFSLLEPEVKYLVRDGVPSMHCKIRLPSGALIRLHAVHPEPPAPTEAESSLPRDAELLMVGRAAKGSVMPTIIAGDLNDVAWSYTTRLFQKISGLLDPRKGRGMFNTYNARNPLMRWPLDHVFHSGHFLLAEMRRLPAFGSDHFPVLVRLVLQSEAASRQAAPEAQPQDRKAAAEKLNKVEKKDSV